MRLALIGLAAGVFACGGMAQDARRTDADARVQAGLDRELKGLVAGRPQSCINSFETRDSSVTSYGETLVYRTTGSTRYVTHTSGCTGIGGNGDNILVTRTPSSQLCRGDIATTVDRTSHFPSGSCSFGDFTPYRKR